MFIFLDGDLVTVFDSQDLSFALQTSRVLKLQVFMNNLSYQDRLNSKLSSDELKNRMREIRDAVSWLFDRIEVSNEGNNNNISNPIRNNQYRIRICLTLYLFTNYFIRTRISECCITRNTIR